MHFGQNDFVQILSACSPNTHQIMYGETCRLVVLAFATVARESFKGKFTAKINIYMIFCEN